MLNNICHHRNANQNHERHQKKTNDPIKKWVKDLNRRHTYGQKPHEKMLNIINYQRNPNQNYNEVSPHTDQNESESESHLVTSNSLRPHGIVHGILYRPEYCSRQPFPSPGDRPNPGIEPRSRALQVDSVPAEAPGNHWIARETPRFVFISQNGHHKKIHNQ